MSEEVRSSRKEPIVARPGTAAIAAVGGSFAIHEWSGSGPDYMHVHRSDDEAWHVLEGALRFEFLEGSVEAPAGTTVFVPAGVPHTYRETTTSRYLIILTPRLSALIAELHGLTDKSRIVETLAKYDTAIVHEKSPH
jgi:mannose-6-phosphate isomerase-like protein (cupin superfamily)